MVDAKRLVLLNNTFVTSLWESTFRNLLHTRSSDIIWLKPTLPLSGFPESMFNCIQFRIENLIAAVFETYSFSSFVIWFKFYLFYLQSIHRRIFYFHYLWKPTLYLIIDNTYNWTDFLYSFERGLKKKLNVVQRVGLGFALSLKRHKV